MAKYEFDGISTDGFNPEDRKEFEEFYENILVEKAPFEVELENKNVMLHLFIEDIDMSEYGDSDDHIITIGVVPSFESLSDKHKEDILSQFMEEDRQGMLEDTFGLVQDNMSYGFSVPLHEERVRPEEVEHTIESAIAVRHAISGLIGFELDRPRNMIGSTGWDLLNDYCDDVDLLTATLSRYGK